MVAGQSVVSVSQLVVIALLFAVCQRFVLTSSFAYLTSIYNFCFSTACSTIWNAINAKSAEE